MSALVITLLVLGGRPQASLLTEPGSALVARRWQQVTRDKELQVVKLQSRDTGQQASGSAALDLGTSMGDQYNVRG